MLFVPLGHNIFCFHGFWVQGTHHTITCYKHINMNIQTCQHAIFDNLNKYISSLLLSWLMSIHVKGFFFVLFFLVVNIPLQSKKNHEWHCNPHRQHSFRAPLAIKQGFQILSNMLLLPFQHFSETCFTHFRRKLFKKVWADEKFL